jgi:formylglycine-generating enzyme required for sulfatase activity
MMTECAELELGLLPAKESGYILDFRFWRPGSAASISLGPASPAPFQVDPVALWKHAADPTLYGLELSRCVFSSPGSAAALAQARAIAAALDVPLRLRLYLHATLPVELHALRWETLADPGQPAVPLAMSERTLFSRFLLSDNPQPFAPPERTRLRALVVISNPANLSQFDALDLAAELQRARSGLVGMDLIELAGRGQATLENLLDGLRKGVDILYLVAHGGLHKQQQKTFLLLERSDGRAQPVFTADLVSRLGEQLPLLAVLVSCQSAGADERPLENPMVALGPALARRGVPAVVAMQGSVTFPTMETFLPAFFKELQWDGQIDRAMAVARATVGDRPDWWMPVLFSRLRDNCLLQPPQAALPLELQRYEPETVYIPAGKFILGSQPGENIPAWECPAHDVILPAYRIGKYPVTNRQYAEFISQMRQPVNPEAGWLGQSPSPDQLDHPVTGVTWYQAMQYCAWLSEKTGRHYTLPNEAEWEKAARGQQGTRYPWGNDWQEGCCNAQTSRITAVDAFPAQGPYGCFDLLGNAREWTLSLWGERRSEPDPAYCYPWADDGRSDPQANTLVRRIFRGGAAEDPSEMTCTYRNAFAPDKSGPPGRRHGFRVVMRINEEKV